MNKFEKAKYILESKGYRVIKESLDDTDDEDLKAAITELANETGNDIDDVEIDEQSYCTEVRFGREEYMLFDDYDNAEEKAIQFCEDLLDDTGIEGIRFEYLGGIEKFVDENWFREAFEEMAEYTIEELDDEELEDQYDTNDPEEAKEKYLENYSDDYIQAYIDEFGKEEFKEVIEKNNLIDYRELAEAIVDTDGVANQLASYDGEEIELSNGYYAYRTN